MIIIKIKIRISILKNNLYKVHKLFLKNMRMKMIMRHMNHMIIMIIIILEVIKINNKAIN